MPQTYDTDRYGSALAKQARSRQMVANNRDSAAALRAINDCLDRARRDGDDEQGAVLRDAHAALMKVRNLHWSRRYPEIAPNEQHPPVGERCDSCAGTGYAPRLPSGTEAD